MKNIQALEAKLEKLRTTWDQVAFGSEFKGEEKFKIMGTIEEEIYLTKQALDRMIKATNS